MTTPTLTVVGHLRRDRYALTLDVSGAEPMRTRHGEVLFQPHRAVVKLTRSGTPEWTLDVVVVTGPNLKKDGSPGALIKENRFTPWNYDRQATPDWVRALGASTLESLNRRQETT